MAPLAGPADASMDIVDSQVHLFLELDEAQGLAAMDALGIRSALIAEFWGLDADGRSQPGTAADDGGWRLLSPGACAAAARHPQRFGYVMRCSHPDDPLLDELVSQARADPRCKAARIDIRKPHEVQAYADGGYRRFFETLRRHGLPVFVLTVGNTPLLQPYAETFADLSFIVDHCGMAADERQYDEILALAQLPNVSMKWCHAPRVFPPGQGAPVYPFDYLQAPLQRALDAFGANRLMWASDFTAIRTGHTWADALFYLRDMPALSPGDRQWILGRTARTVLNWEQ